MTRLLLLLLTLLFSLSDPAMGKYSDFWQSSNVVNAGISAGRGDFVGAGFNLASSLPGLGDAFAAGKIATAAVGVAVAKSASHAVSSTAATAAKVEAAVVKETTTTGFRYVGEAEAQIIRNTGSIPMVDRFGNSKNVFYTNESFSSAASAQKALSLPSTPKFRAEFDMGKAPAGYGGIADPLYGQPGGGAEFILREGAGAIPSTRIIQLGP
jgi:hypothetical protein